MDLLIDYSVKKTDNSTTESRPKRIQKMRPLAHKIKVIQRIKAGECKAKVAREIGVPESTIRGWCKSEHSISLALMQKSGIACPSTGTESVPYEYPVEDSEEQVVGIVEQFLECVIDNDDDHDVSQVSSMKEYQPPRKKQKTEAHPENTAIETVVVMSRENIVHLQKIECSLIASYIWICLMVHEKINVSLIHGSIIYYNELDKHQVEALRSAIAHSEMFIRWLEGLHTPIITQRDINILKRLLDNLKSNVK